MKTAIRTVLPLAAAALLGSPALASDEERALAAENYMQADADADGALTRAEFTMFINLNADDNLGRAAMVRRFGKHDVAFARADGDGDGRVTPEELAEISANR